MSKLFVRILIAAGSVLVAAPIAYAVTPAAPVPASQSGQGLEISPPVLELQAEPGQTVIAHVKVRDITSGTLSVTGRVDDFGAGKLEDGAPHILLDETGATRYSLKYWVTGVPNLNLGSQELKDVPITIAVPKNAEPGGHYGVVRFSGKPPELNGTGVSLSASVGTLILLKIAGPITDNVSVASFNVGVLNKNSSFTNKSFFEHGPVDFNVRLRNDGSVHEKAFGRINVTDVFGHVVGAVATNAKGGNVLPGSVRRFNETLSQKQLFGYYTAKLALTYAGNKPLNATIGFWVIPWKLLLLVLLGLIVLFFLLKVGLRRYNEHIIAQARRRR